MYIFRKFLFITFLLLGMASYMNLHSLSAADQMGGGNRFNTGGQMNFNRMYNGNEFSNSFYRGVEGNNNGYYNVEPIDPFYGYGYYAPNSQVFPDETQANNLYWGEVQQMESQ